MRAGELDRRIVIQQNTPTRNAAGEEVDSWGTLATVWARVSPKRGREFFDARAVQAEAPAMFRIRYRADVTNAMRISYGGNFYDIHSVEEVGRQVATEIFAAAEVS